MVDHLQSRVTPWHQYASHVKVRGTLSKMDVIDHETGYPFVMKDNYCKDAESKKYKITPTAFKEVMGKMKNNSAP